jgi:16S rRNA G966 N2-methylase RsmD
VTIIKGDSLELIQGYKKEFDLIATDPPYAFGGTGDEHAISATVAIVLREAAQKLKTGGWMIVMCASSWRSTSYMVEAVRGIVDPVRIGTWVKPRSRTKTNTPGWKWASVNVIAFRKGKNNKAILPNDRLDYILEEIVMNGRRAELPSSVADWAVAPFAIRGGKMLDPFAGSGRLCEAAERAGMVAIGFEKNPLPSPAVGTTPSSRASNSCFARETDHGQETIDGLESLPGPAPH